MNPAFTQLAAVVQLTSIEVAAGSNGNRGIYDGRC
jgi:hypothetical protein